jgi:hypothetical protein
MTLATHRSTTASGPLLQSPSHEVDLVPGESVAPASSRQAPKPEAPGSTESSAPFGGRIVSTERSIGTTSGGSSGRSAAAPIGGYARGCHGTGPPRCAISPRGQMRGRIGTASLRNRVSRAEDRNPRSSEPTSGRCPVVVIPTYLIAAPMGATVVNRACGPGPVTCVCRRAGRTIVRDLPRSCPGCVAVWEGVQLERPQPRSGEDERAGRRRAAADHRERGRVPFVLVVGVVGVPGAWWAEWSRKHPFGVSSCSGRDAMTMCPGPGCSVK